MNYEHKMSGIALSKGATISGVATDPAGWNMTIVGYASTFGGPPDGYGDIIAPGAYTATIADNPRIPLLWSHAAGDLPLGRVEYMIETEIGLAIRADLPHSSRAVDLSQLVTRGIVDALSIGYFVVESHPDTWRGQKVRILDQIELMEISLVNFPANKRARLVSGLDVDGLLDTLVVAEFESTKDRDPGALALYVDAQRRLIEGALNGGQTEEQWRASVLAEIRAGLADVAKVDMDARALAEAVRAGLAGMDEIDVAEAIRAGLADL